MQETEKIQVLVVDDSATIRHIIAKHLGENYLTVHAGNGQEAWQKLQSNNSISLVFVDLHMPVMNGMALLQQIRNSDCKRVANLSVIMITGHEDSEAAKQASYNMGATDFISKPFSELDIISRAGSYTKLSQKISSLEQNVSHDSLTRLLNERGLQEQGNKELSSSQRHLFELSILSVQIENNDEILSKFGVNVIEQIIVSVADNIKKSLRNEDVSAHLGAGRFVVLLPMTKVFKAHIIALRIQRAIGNLAFKKAGSVIRIKLAMGLNSTEGNSQYINFTELSLQTEKALQASLQHRECKVVRYDELPSKEQLLDQHSTISSDTEEQESVLTNLAASSKKSFTENLSHHMSAIFNGDFEKIPAQHVDNLIEPLESFLAYAHGRL